MNIHLSQRHPHADGVTPDTALFQQALDELAEAGGGTLVSITAGTRSAACG